ncbi:hypothetical protein I6N95_11560 [Vagococcus sp. BWB3-3]|uniref:Uncharacterized protein n=1 Tax=Vagococcus allomyrinae TaxID=2794353 RepID=A0A940P4Y2_9ENTE|nr:hypothetical protein [Vagococcus allomyrinae]MBP1041644.1 hypothetical protein [Vagococcus allomyrinae]
MIDALLVFILVPILIWALIVLFKPLINLVFQDRIAKEKEDLANEIMKAIRLEVDKEYRESIEKHKGC